MHSVVLVLLQQHGRQPHTRPPEVDSVDQLNEGQELVAGYLRIADHRGSDVRLDAGTPYRVSAWPRVPVSPQQWAWKVLLSYKWRRSGHINVLETQALFDAIRRLAKNPRTQSTRRLCLTDSQAALGVLTKGRSSSRRLNFVLLRLAGLLRATDMQLFYAWAPSKANPADGPSRWAIKRK